MKQHGNRTKMTFEEVRRMLDEFYDEVESREKADGVTLHVVAQKPEDKTFVGRLRRLFKINNH